MIQPNIRGVVPFWVSWGRPVPWFSEVWFVEDSAPFRQGWGVGLGRLWLGVCWRSAKKSHDTALGSGWQDTPPVDIGFWGIDAPTEK